MRVVLTVNFSPWSPYSGGGQRSTHNLASALVRRGHEVTVVYTRAVTERFGPPSPPPYEIVWAPFAGLKSRRQAPLRPLNALGVARAVAKLTKAGDVDAVHGNGEEAAALGRLRDRRGFVFVVTPRFPDYPGPLLRPAGPTPVERVKLAVGHAKYLVLGRAVQAADWVCPTSDSARAMVRRAFDVDPAHMRVVPNGITPAFFDVEHPGTVADDAPIVFFGRLSLGKGVDTLIDALGKLRGQAPRTLVIGRGDLRDELERRAATLGIGDRVTFVDWMDPPQLAAQLARARLAVLPSREESFGNAIAEAMAVGCPVISTGVGSIPEIVDDGHTGVLVPVADSDALATAIDDLLADSQRARTIADAGRASVRRRYTWDAVAAQFEACYRGRPS